jgi:hypothetical protein
MENVTDSEGEPRIHAGNHLVFLGVVVELGANMHFAGSRGRSSTGQNFERNRSVGVSLRRVEKKEKLSLLVTMSRGGKSRSFYWHSLHSGEESSQWTHQEFLQFIDALVGHRHIIDFLNFITNPQRFCKQFIEMSSVQTTLFTLNMRMNLGLG